MDPLARRAELERIDPEAAARIHPADERRAVRALEVYRLTGKTISSLQGQWGSGTPREGVRLMALSWPVEDQNRRINARVREMIEAGLLDEVRGLVTGGTLNRQACEALGYKQLLAHLHDPRTIPLDDAVEQVKIETRRFAKNQRTWLKRLGATPGAVKIEAWTDGPENAVRRGVEWLGG
jgi:tRNA dimethylallyltransferase